MTHGVGSVGHHSGGGFSSHHHGTGWTSTHHHHHGRHNGHSYRGSSGPLCPYPRATLYVLLSFALIIAPLVLAYRVYGSHTVTLSPRDTRLVQFNPLFNRAVRLTDDSAFFAHSNATAWLYSFKGEGKPPLQRQRDYIQINRTVSIRRGKYEYWSYHLIPPASAYVEVTTKNPFSFYIFKGSSNFNEWLEDVTQNTSIAGYFSTRTYAYPVTIRLFNKNIDSVNDYYFVFANMRTSSGSYGLDMRIVRSLYDYGKAYDSCSVNRWTNPYGTGERECTVSIPKSDHNDHSRGYVLLVAANSSDPEANISLEYIGLSNAGGYLAISLGPFFVISCIFAFIAVRWRRSRRRSQATVSTRVVTTTTNSRSSRPQGQPARSTAAKASKKRTATKGKPSVTRVTHVQRDEEEAPLLGEVGAKPGDGSSYPVGPQAAVPSAPPPEQSGGTLYGMNPPPSTAPPAYEDVV